MNNFYLNEQIARLRKKNNMTQEKFASLLGVSNQAVSKWEAGTCCPDIQLLPTIAGCFGVSIDALFATNDYESRLRLLTQYECTDRDDDFEAARDAYERVLLSGSATTADHNDYAFLFAHRGRIEVEKAEKLYENALKFGEQNCDDSYYLIHTRLINLLCWRGRFEECISRYAEKIKEEPDNWWNHYLLSLAYMQSGKAEHAWSIIEQAFNQFESNFYLDTIAGNLCEKLGDYDHAIQYWKKAYAENPKQISCLYSKAFLFEQLGRKQEAIDSWQQIVKWHHDNDLFHEHETDMPLKHIEMLHE